MSFWTFVFAVAITAIAAGVFIEWIKAKHGSPAAQSTDGADALKMQAICAENEELKKQVAELTERLIVLERIATDPAERVSREIEKLR